MSQSFLALPLGSPGAAVVVPVSEGLKTFVVGGTFDADAVILEISPDGTKYDRAASVSLVNAGPQKAVFSAGFARVKVVNLRSGTPVPVLALNTITGSQVQAAFVVPAEGVSALVALDTLPRAKTLFALAEGPAVSSELVLEVSLDDTKFTALLKLDGALCQSGLVSLVEGFFKSGQIRRLSGGAGWTVIFAADPTCC